MGMEMPFTTSSVASHLNSRRIAKDNSRKLEISVTKVRLGSTLRVGDRAGMNGLGMRIPVPVTNISVDDVVWR